MPSLASLPSFYDTYRQRTAENEQAGMRDLQQISSLMQLRNAAQEQQKKTALQSAIEAIPPEKRNAETILPLIKQYGSPMEALKLEAQIEDRKSAREDRALQLTQNYELRKSALEQQKELALQRATDKKAQDDILNAFRQRQLDLDAQHKEMMRGLTGQKTYPIVQTAEGIFERRPEGLVLLKGPDGKPLNPTVRERPITEYQGKNAMYGARASMAHDTLMKLEDKINVAGLATKRALQDMPVVGGLLGAGANVALSKEQQQVEQAQRNFVNAVLRQESGAVINPSEFENAIKQYFPQPGDKPEVIKQKRENRLAVIAGFKKIAGHAWNDEQAISSGSNGGWSIEPAK